MIWMYTCSLNKVAKVAKVAPQAFDLATLAIRLNEIGDPYESFPVFESQRFLLRSIRDEDIEDLLAVYSDPKSQPFFNSDNCHGDDFRYETVERMRQAMDFWDYSYKGQNLHSVGEWGHPGGIIHRSRKAT